MNNGEVILEWEPPYIDLIEGFEVLPTIGWVWDTPGGTLDIEDGYAKLDMTGTDTWGSGVYDEIVYMFGTLHGYLETRDDLTTSRGVVFRTNGTHDADFDGYGFYISDDSYSAWMYEDGAALSIVPWTTSTAINTGNGAVNELKVYMLDGTFDLFVNSTYLTTFSESTYSQGFVGLAQNSNLTWWDGMYCYWYENASLDQPAQSGELVAAYYDDKHNPVDQPLPTAPNVRVYDRYGEPGGGQLEWLYYKVYRDGNLIATPGPFTLTYTDNLPGAGEYVYEVTAYSDNGESDPSDPAVVNWDYITLTLTPQVTVIPATGGDLVYDASLVSTIPVNQPGLRYQTFATLPNGGTVGPINNIPWNLTPYMNITVTGLSVTVPATAPAGDYVFTGKAGVPNVPAMLEIDSFEFTKEGAASLNDGNGDWLGDFVASDFTINVAGQLAANVPTEFALENAYPNPFNPTTTIAVTLPSATDLTVSVYNISGQLVATIAEGGYNAGRHTFTFSASNLASGLYFVHAMIPGHAEQTQKVMLVR